MIATITSKFARCFGGIRTTQDTHDFSTAFNNAIKANPAEVTNWLVLADRLEEVGELAYHAIRYVFQADYVLPVGFTGSIERGARYYEGGSMYYSGFALSIDAEGTLETSYYCGGGWWRTSLTQADAVKRLATVRDSKAGEWCDLVVTGSLPAQSACLNVGTEVEVTLPTGKVIKNYPTKTCVAVPLPLTCYDGYTVVFNLDGHEIRVAKEKVTLSV